MKNKFKITTAICILSGVFVGAVYHYIRPNTAIDSSVFTSLRKQARSEQQAGHSAQLKLERSSVETTSLSSAQRPADSWHDVKVLLAGKDLHLTDSEIALLQTRYAELVNDRESIELAIAKLQKIDNTKTLITIPAYAKAGRELYSAFIKDVTADFGSSRADQVLDALDSTIIACNFGLGQQPQAILAEDQSGLLKISRGRTAITTKVGLQNTALPDVNATGFYTKNQLNAFEYLRPLLLSRN